MMLLFSVHSFYWPDKEGPEDLSDLSESKLIVLTVIVIIWEVSANLTCLSSVITSVVKV